MFDFFSKIAGSFYPLTSLSRQREKTKSLINTTN